MSKFTEYLEQVNGNKETLESIIKKIDNELPKNEYFNMNPDIKFDEYFGLGIEGGGHDPEASFGGSISLKEIEKQMKNFKGNGKFGIDYYASEADGDEGADGMTSMEISANLLRKLIKLVKEKNS